MKIAYGKVGRSIPLSLTSASNVGGDIEVVRLLEILLERGHEVHLVGRNRGDLQHSHLVNHWSPGGLFGNVPDAARAMGPTFDVYNSFIQENARQLPKFDAWIIWLGQHGSSLHPVPAVQAGKIGTYTNPMISDVNYAYPIIAILNVLNITPDWLCPDPRNMIKFRDLWNPHQRVIHAQYNTRKNNTFWDERLMAPVNGFQQVGKLHEGETVYAYSGIELLAAPLTSETYVPRAVPDQPFGLLVNEGYNNIGSKGRLHVIKEWCRDLGKYDIVGTWSESSQAVLGRTITPCSLSDVTVTLQRWQSTMTFPATGSGWATAKPWECFKAGTICFKHPGYDTQNHIYNRHFMVNALGESDGMDLFNFLTPFGPAGLKMRINDLDAAETSTTYERYSRLQYRYFVHSHHRLHGGAGPLLASITGRG